MTWTVAIIGRHKGPSIMRKRKPKKKKQGDASKIMEVSISYPKCNDTYSSLENHCLFDKSFVCSTF